jgi:hypothetical protein
VADADASIAFRQYLILCLFGKVIHDRAYKPGCTVTAFKLSPAGFQLQISKDENSDSTAKNSDKTLDGDLKLRSSGEQSFANALRSCLFHKAGAFVSDVCEGQFAALGLEKIAVVGDIFLNSLGLDPSQAAIFDEQRLHKPLALSFNRVPPDDFELHLWLVQGLVQHDWRFWYGCDPGWESVLTVAARVELPSVEVDGRPVPLVAGGRIELFSNPRSRALVLQVPLGLVRALKATVQLRPNDGQFGPHVNENLGDVFHCGDRILHIWNQRMVFPNKADADQAYTRVKKNTGV